MESGEIYFLIGYLDQRCTVPFVRSLVYLRSESRADVREYYFADAVAWYANEEPSEAALEGDDFLLVAESDLETIKDLRGLIQELTTIG